MMLTSVKHAITPYNSFKNLYSISTRGDNVSVKSQIDSRVLASNNIDKR